MRWADYEAARLERERRLQLGFVVGSTWAHIPEHKVNAILQGKPLTSASEDEDNHDS